MLVAGENPRSCSIVGSPRPLVPQRLTPSQCDGSLPSCAACSSVYNTPCPCNCILPQAGADLNLGVYDPGSDHRRKRAHKDTGTLRARSTTLQILVQAILDYDDDEALELLHQIRTCDNLEDVAQSIVARENGRSHTATTGGTTGFASNDPATPAEQFEYELARQLNDFVLDGSRKFIGSTSNLSLRLSSSPGKKSASRAGDPSSNAGPDAASVKRWTHATDDDSLISHLVAMYFTWHYPFYPILAKDAFYMDFVRGVPTTYCSALLVNSILALGCHFSSRQGAWAVPGDATTAGNHFFEEAKRLALENDEHENANLCNVQAFALMSVREAGCGREGSGWVYSGLSFRMALDIGLNLDTTNLGPQSLSGEEIDARRITFWGCYLIDKWVPKWPYVVQAHYILILSLGVGQITSAVSLNSPYLILACLNSTSYLARRPKYGLHIPT